MPHYVTQLDDVSEDTFGVYSTVVDNLITPEMSGAEMKAWLIDRDYKSWLLKPGDNSDLADSGLPEAEQKRTAEWREKQADRYYWNTEHEFQYVKLSDHWFTLPREAWRYE